jgi:hypothetical protein
MVISCLYWLFRHLLELIELRWRSEAANEVEILVLRHELAGASSAGWTAELWAG